MNIDDTIKALKQRIAELECYAREEREFPQRGEKYHFIEANGGVNWFQWNGSGFGLRAKDIGNLFHTKEQAEFAVEKLKVENDLRKFSRPFEPMVSNFHMILDTSDGSVDVKCMVFGNVQGAIYFESKEKAQQAISTVGDDRIKKYIFGLEEK